MICLISSLVHVPVHAHLQERVDDEVRVLGDDAGHRVDGLVLQPLVEMPDDAEVHERHGAVLEHDDVPGVRVGMEKPELEDLPQHGVEAVLQDLSEVHAHLPDALEIVELDAVDEFRHENFHR